MINFLTSPLEYLSMRIMFWGIAPTNLIIVSILSSIIAFPFVLLSIRFFKKTSGTFAGKLLKSSVLGALLFIGFFYLWSSIIMKASFPVATWLVRGIIGGGFAGLLGFIPLRIHERYLKEWNMPFYLEVYLLTLLMSFVVWILLYIIIAITIA